MLERIALRFACTLCIHLKKRMTTQPSLPLRILVVEDELIVSADLCILLEELGYETVGTATTSEEALAVASAVTPDLILMDIRLAGAMDGIETAACVRESLDVPVIFLTANTDSSTVDRALETGPGGYVSKPFNARTLFATIELTMRRHREALEAKSAHRDEVAELHAQNLKLGNLAERFRQDSIVDPLTGLHNRRYLELASSRELSRARRDGRPIGVIMLDLDRFKAFNDTFGHLAADEVLKSVAAFLRTRLRTYDIACRYGGEEIVVITPGATSDDALAVAEQLRGGIEALRRGVCRLAARARDGVVRCRELPRAWRRAASADARRGRGVVSVEALRSQPRLAASPFERLSASRAGRQGGKAHLYLTAGRRSKRELSSELLDEHLHQLHA
jgi:two-component system, cell cycle response regulator